MSTRPLIAVIVLAAGESSRLGSPKQLLKFRGKTLLQRIVDEVDQLEVAERYIVLGSGAADITKQVHAARSKTVLADDWKSGMAASLKAGLKSIDDSNIDALLIVLADQPFVTAKLLEQIIAEFERSGKGIIASQYNEVIGVPVLFAKKYFPDLLALSGDHGAQSIIKTYMNDCHTVPFEKGYIDIDTKEDMEQLTDK